jgi:hypothetical protein
MISVSVVPTAETRRLGRWAVAVVMANCLFVVGWLVAAVWQGPRYRVLADTISDMYANGAPGAVFLIVVITLSGVAVLLFTWLSLWPSLRSGGWSATVGATLLALSIFGLGDLLTPFEREACQQADPGCTVADQLGNVGGTLDAILSSVGVVLLIAAGFFLAAAMKRAPGWHHWSRPTRWASVGMIVLVVADVLADSANLGGLVERLVAAAGAAGIAALAFGVLRHSRTW